MAKCTGKSTSSRDKYQLNKKNFEKLKQGDALQGNFRLMSCYEVLMSWY